MTQLDRIEATLLAIGDKQSEIREAVAALQTSRAQSTEAMQQLQNSVQRVDDRLRVVEGWKGRIGGLLLAGGGAVGTIASVISHLILNR